MKSTEKTGRMEFTLGQGIIGGPPILRFDLEDCHVDVLRFDEGEDVCKSYLKYDIYRTDDDGVEETLFRTACDEASVIADGNLIPILRSIAAEDAEQEVSVQPNGYGVTWEMKKYLAKNYASDYEGDSDCQEGSWVIRFTLVEWFSGRAYRFLLKNEEAMTLAAFLEEAMAKVMIGAEAN